MFSFHPATLRARRPSGVGGETGRECCSTATQVRRAPSNREAGSRTRTT